MNGQSVQKTLVRKTNVNGAVNAMHHGLQSLVNHAKELKAKRKSVKMSVLLTAGGLTGDSGQRVAQVVYKHRSERVQSQRLLMVVPIVLDPNMRSNHVVADFVSLKHHF